MTRTYKFSNNAFYDFKTNGTVNIDGERDVVIRTYGSFSVACVAENKIIAQFKVEPGFDINQYRNDLQSIGPFFTAPIFEFVIRLTDLDNSTAQRIV